MKINELMVGDLVNVNGLNLKVGAIHADEIGVFDPDYKIYWCSDDGLDRIDPIPLTEEILVKNGFHTYGESYFIPEDKCNAHVRIGFHYRETEVDLHRHGAFSIQISYKPGMLYVHTLQHLLRERGIDKEIEL